ncbi:acetate--CoA ligase family protein, partial [Neobacillus niacini]|uniref:acetate--CoA ligase family protein n=1 Tax=Neobacillus niacini TaxID=86668 RepID=UPI0030001280
IYQKSGALIFYNLDSLLNTISVIGNKSKSKKYSEIQPTSSVSQKFIDRIRDFAQGTSGIDEYQGKTLLNELGIPAVKGYLANSKEKVLIAASKLGYPVVLKVVSPDVLHKTDAGLVKINLKTPEQLSEAYEIIMDNFEVNAKGAELRGVLVEEMFDGDMELIVGIKNDPSFGPMIMVGAGGIFTEVFHDITTRMCPINEDEATQMMKELNYSKILQGYRGKNSANLQQIASIISQLSILSYNIKDIFDEMEINPLLISSSMQMGKAADIVLTLKKLEVQTV